MCPLNTGSFDKSFRKRVTCTSKDADSRKGFSAGLCRQLGLLLNFDTDTHTLVVLSVEDQSSDGWRTFELNC